MWWPAALTSANLDYLAPIPCPVGTSRGLVVARASLCISPSGDGELAVLDLRANAQEVVAQLTGGAPGRVYRSLIIVTYDDAQVQPFIVSMRVALGGVLPWEVPPPPVAAYGTPIVWTPEAVVFGTPLLSVLSGLIATGTDVSTALLLRAWTNLVSSAPPGTSVLLPVDGIVSGTVVVQNDDPVNNLAVRPPPGAQINRLAVDAPFYVSAMGGRISFSTNDPTTLWGAG